MKQKVGELYGKPVVVGNPNEFEKHEIPLNDFFRMIQEQPGLLRRPIIIDDKRLQIGYNEDEIRRFLPRAVRALELQKARALVNE